MSKNPPVPSVFTTRGYACCSDFPTWNSDLMGCIWWGNSENPSSEVWLNAPLAAFSQIRKSAFESNTTQFFFLKVIVSKSFLWFTDLSQGHTSAADTACLCSFGCLPGTSSQEHAFQSVAQLLSLLFLTSSDVIFNLFGWLQLMNHLSINVLMRHLLSWSF